MAPSSQDNLLYFGIRARAEATRMMYAIAGKKLTDERLGFDEWPMRKPGNLYKLLRTQRDL